MSRIGRGNGCWAGLAALLMAGCAEQQSDEIKLDPMVNYKPVPRRTSGVAFSAGVIGNPKRVGQWSEGREYVGYVGAPRTSGQTPYMAPQGVQQTNPSYLGYVDPGDRIGRRPTYVRTGRVQSKVAIGSGDSSPGGTGRLPARR